MTTFAPPPSRNDPCPCGSGRRYKHCHGAAGAAPAPAAPAQGRIATAADPEVRDVMYAALEAQQAKRLDEAERLYRAALDRSPQNVDALHMLGVLQYSKGEFANAERLIEAADDLTKRTLPAIAHNLSMVRVAMSLVRGELTIGSLLQAGEAQRKAGFDALAGATCEATTKLLAFYLPQYHRIPENDLWWGEGFTEWVNVRRAKPNFEGHYQPHEPGELGYYDLSDEEVLVRQAALAREYGVSGFCFYYYWFSGRRLLDMPLDRMLRTGRPDFPYCLCWANENWSRNWDGGNREVLVEQGYRSGDPEHFIADILPHFRDPRYIRVHGRPLLMVYRVGRIPDPRGTFDAWRAACIREGLPPPYIVIAATFEESFAATDVGADAVSEFPPHGANVNIAIAQRLAGLRAEHRGHFVGYLQNIASFLNRPEPAGAHFPGIVPSWDNTARRQDDGLCMVESSPEAFELWLRELVFRASRKPDGDERIVFINAWNEWAEGCHLEPDRRYGRAWLEACRRARLLPPGYQSVFGLRRDPPGGAEASPPGSSARLPIADLERPPSADVPPVPGSGTAAVVTLFPGGAPTPGSPLLFRGGTPADLVADHEQPLPAPPLEVFCLPDATLHGAGWVSRDGRVLFDPAIQPGYCLQWYRENRIYNDQDADLDRLVQRRYRSGWHVVHFNCGVYGHWLAEVMPKLFAIAEFLRRWPAFHGMPLFMPAVFPNYVYAHTREILPVVPIVTYDPQRETIHAGQLHLPTWGVDHAYHGFVARQCDALFADAVPDAPRPRIFVSRRRQSAFRTLDNAAEIEAIAREEGLAVVYPEDHSLREQVAIFRHARLVAGEFGSALHNAIFSPAGTTVLALNWINAYQSRIARLKGHRIGYLLPESGEAVLFDPDAPTRMQHYAIDPATFRARLREAIGASSGGAAA